MLLRIVWCLGATVCLAHGRGRQLVEDEAERCKDQAGYKDGEYIVGERAYNAYAARNDTDGVYSSWNTSEDLLTITKDCPFKYEMHHGDTITLLFTRMEHYGTMGFDFTQEYQDGSDRLPGIRWFFAWEKYVDYYREKYGDVGESCWDSQYVPWSAQPSGSYSWWADQFVEDLTDVRRDFYHQLNRTAGRMWHYSWRRRRNGRTYLSPQYGNQQHYGTDNGQLRVVLSAAESDQVTDKGQDTVYVGELEFHEWGGTGDIKKEQYDALKQFYQETCANRRNGTAWNQPWVEPWSGWTWRQQVDNNHDKVPYCTWLKDGWNESYWDSHISNQGGTCHMIPGVRCNSDGDVSYLAVSYEGMRGSVMNTWAKFTGLETVSCSFNQFTGSLPQFISSSQHIRSFSIWHNFFEGSVPCLVGPQISYMDVSYNNFDGSLPACYGENPRWRTLYLEHCYISGSYPKEWRTLKAVGTMWVKYNELSGSLPEEICNLNQVSSLNFEGNRIEGQIPSKCLWTKKISDQEVEGWTNIYTLTAAHNRLSGGLPRINAEAKTAWALRYGTFDFDHNFFDGTIKDQWEAMLNISRSVTFLFRDNRLSGPLPAQIEGWSKTYWQRVRYDFADNFFRCEPDGRWPDWVQRRVDDDLWGSTITNSLGKCLPVAHPELVTPQAVTEGQASTLYIQGKDFVQRAFQTCRYTHEETKENTDAAAIRIDDFLIRCQVPVNLPRGKYEITVSNFGTDFATNAILSALRELPKVEVVPVPVVEGANAIEATMTLGGVTEAQFANQEAQFVEAIAEYVGQELSTIRILDTNSVAQSSGRRLQTGASVSPRILVSVNATKGEEYARGIINKLKSDAEVESALRAKNIEVKYVTIVQVGSMVVEDQAPGGGGSDSDSEVPIVWIIIAAISGVIACGLCGFIGFLYHMERKGQAYFKEQLDDIPEQETAAAAPPQKIGAGDPEEGADV